MHKLFTALIAGLVTLASCGSPPKPPTVDATRRHPVNAAAAVELQVCKNDLQNTRITAVESSRIADTATARLANIGALQRALNEMQDLDDKPSAGNSVYMVRFAFASARVEIPDAVSQVLLNQARRAPLVFLRGRTDGTSDATAESRMARDRADAVRDYLVAGGVDPGRIRASYQPSGDRVADNDSAGGRSLNRRVEIELYRSLPVSLNLATAAP